MKKALLAVSLSITLAWGIGDVGKPNVFTPNTVAQSSQVNANFDSAFHSINRLKDSVEAKFIRFTDLTSGDSTLTRLQVDTIVTGYILPTRIGAFTALNFTADTITCDSINNASGINTARLTASGKIVGDSLVSSKGARITNLLFAGNIQSGDSIIGSGFRATNGIKAATLTTSGNVGIGSDAPGAKIEIYESGASNTPLIVRKADTTLNSAQLLARFTARDGSGSTYRDAVQIREGNAATEKNIPLTVGSANDTSVYATGIIATATKVCGDSLVSAKGARITNRIVTSEIQVSDSLIAQNSARITSTGKIIGDSIVSLKGARITNLLFAGNIQSGDSITASGKIVGDSLVSSKGARITNLLFAGNIQSGDSIIGSGFRATNGITASGKIVGDSLVSSKGARITNHIATATITASGNVQGDSLISAKGARITNRIVTSEIQVSDSLIAPNSARITSTGKIIGDSIVSLKGARITNHIATATITASGNVQGDSLISAKGARVTNEITCATINTGLGSTEVPVYTTGTFACSLFNATFEQVKTARYVKFDSLITIYLPSFDSLAEVGNLTLHLSTTALDPSSPTLICLPYYDDAGGIFHSGLIEIGSIPRIWTVYENAVVTGPIGLQDATSITYYKD